MRHRKFSHLPHFCQTTVVKPPKPVKIVAAGISTARQQAHVDCVRAAKIEEAYNERHSAALNDDAARLYAAFTAHIAQAGAFSFYSTIIN